MAKFEPGVTVATSDPQIVVDSDPANPLPVGLNRFNLVVVDDAGNESEPASIVVIVRDESRPTAVLDVVDANGLRLDPVVAAGAPFFLSGARSSDIAPGKVTEYRFTLQPRA